MVDAALFDWDGTLADTMSVIVESFQKTLSGINCTVEDEFIVRCIGIGDRLLFREAIEHKSLILDDSMLDRLVRTKNVIQLSRIPEIPLLPGVIELLDCLRGKIRMALATMSNRNVIEVFLREKRLKRYFEVVIAADDVVQPKPSPEIFLKCALELGVQPRDCVVFEDSIFGIKAAKCGGMKCLATATGAYSMTELTRAGADIAVTSLTEMEKITEFLFG